MILNVTGIRRTTVGHRIYKVKWLPETDTTPYVGQVFHMEGRIEMLSGRPLKETTDTFLHELLHCVNSVLGDRVSEAYTRRTATLLAQALLSAR